MVTISDKCDGSSKNTLIMHYTHPVHKSVLGEVSFGGVLMLAIFMLATTARY